MPRRVFFFFFGLKFCTNVKNKYEKRIFGHFFFWRKKSLDLQKIKNHVLTFPYWFWFGNKILNVLIGSLDMSSFNVRSPFGFLITNVTLKNEKNKIH